MVVERLIPKYQLVDRENQMSVTQIQIYYVETGKTMYLDSQMTLSNPYELSLPHKHDP